ncbi:MAG: DUF2064 domain-containing protein, partial [Bacteroidota bacterium]|nr:DUF2064 domain-containing protein [Bacteroidota bacterium]
AAFQNAIPAFLFRFSPKIHFYKSIKGLFEGRLIIGSDCLELNDEIIADAFDYLEKHEIVLGSAKDGGY